MRINCGHGYEVKERAKKWWHNYFLWFPKRIRGSKECVWLEFVERRLIIIECGWSNDIEYYEYRLKELT